MSSISPRRTLVALTLAALVGLPSLALAAPRAPRQAPPEVHGSLVSRAWTFFLHFWGFEGMSIDPDGRSLAPVVRHLSAPSGMSIDPDGSHAAAPPAGTRVSGDAGMLIDPNG